MRIAEAAVFEHPGVVFRSPHFGAGDLLDLGQRGGVVPVGLLSQQDADVFEPESERRHVLADHRRGILKTGVDENMSFIGSDQEHGKIVGSDAIEIADDLEAGIRPDPALGLRPGLIQCSQHKTQYKDDSREFLFHTGFSVSPGE